MKSIEVKPKIFCFWHANYNHEIRLSYWRLLIYLTLLQDNTIAKHCKRYIQTVTVNHLDARVNTLLNEDKQKFTLLNNRFSICKQIWVQNNTIYYKFLIKINCPLKFSFSKFIAIKRMYKVWANAK